MGLGSNIVNGVIKYFFRIVCRIDDAALAKIPARGPLILVCNHINAIEVPIMFTHVLPRPVTGFAKVETWDNPFKNVLFTFWKAIPITRGTVDREAFRLALAALDKGMLLAVAPEGTRSYDGQMQQGHTGVIPLAQRSGAPLIPVVFWGAEHFWRNLLRLRRTDFHTAVGTPFYLKTTEKYITKEERQEIIDEIMYQLAQLLPEQYRGVYADLSRATTHHLDFDKPVN